MKAYFAGGCFWGMEYYMKRIPGVVAVTSGYMGGTEENPTYREVKAHLTGHAETVEVEYDPEQVTYREIAMRFFEIHDPTQLDAQGIDKGHQYRSEVFYADQEQKRTAEELIGILKSKGYAVVTALSPASRFWKAEDYHQDYFARNGGEPDCHFYTKRF